MRCTVCSNPQVAQIDALLTSGSSVRAVARIHGLARSTVARHRGHISAATARLAVIQGQRDPPGPPDPLSEAFALAEKARTPRERLRALEQVRAASKLRLRGITDLDDNDRYLLDGNIRAAEEAYRAAPDFETAARALSGWREALTQRLDAVLAPEGVPVQYFVGFTDEVGNVSEAGGPDRGEPVTFLQPLAIYFADVPKRFHDSSRYVVDRTTFLSFTGSASDDAIRVLEAATGALVWANKSEHEV